MKKKSKLIFLSLIIFSLLLLLWLKMDHKKAHQPEKQKDNPLVSLTHPQKSLYQPTIQAIGILEANQGALIKAQTNGQIKKIHFTPGQEVKENELLVEFNHNLEEGVLDSALTQEKLNASIYKRDLELKKLGAISLASLDEAKAALDLSQAAVKQAKAAYDLTYILAPFSGRVGINKVSVGDYLQSGDAIVSLENLEPMLVIFYLPQKYLPKLKIGANIHAKTETSQKIIQGKILDYETIIDEKTGMIQVRACIPNPDNLLLPGGQVNLSIETEQEREVITLPQMALLYDEKGSYVYIVKENIAYKKYAKTGRQIKQSIEIISGLSLEDSVIVEGSNKVKDKQKVEIIPFEKDDK